MITKIKEGIYKFAAGVDEGVRKTGTSVRKRIERVSTGLIEDLIGLTAEKRALKSDEFKLFKKENPGEAAEYERSLENKIRKLKGE